MTNINIHPCICLPERPHRVAVQMIGLPEGRRCLQIEYGDTNLGIFEGAAHADFERLLAELREAVAVEKPGAA